MRWQRLAPGIRAAAGRDGVLYVVRSGRRSGGDAAAYVGGRFVGTYPEPGVGRATRRLGAIDRMEPTARRRLVSRLARLAATYGSDPYAIVEPGAS